MELYIKKLEEDAKVPTKDRMEDEGFDLYANEEVTLKPMTTTMIKTGIAAMCNEEHWLQIEGRSGLASKGIFPVGGVIDHGFSGCLCVLLVNMTQREFLVTKHSRIAQMVIRDRHPASIVEVDQFGPSDRGAKGFGSSGN